MIHYYSYINRKKSTYWYIDRYVDLSTFDFEMFSLKCSHDPSTGILGYPDSESEDINRKKSTYWYIDRYIDLSTFDFKVKNSAKW